MLCFVLICAILVIVPPTGAASAGLASGFLLPLSWHKALIGIICVAVLCARLRGRVWMLLPLAYLVAFMGSALSAIEASYSLLPLYVYGAYAVLILLGAMVRSAAALLAMAVCVSFALHHGAASMAHLPDFAHALYYVLGQLLAHILALASVTAVTMLCVSTPSRNWRIDPQRNQ